MHTTNRDRTAKARIPRTPSQVASIKPFTMAKPHKPRSVDPLEAAMAGFKMRQRGLNALDNAMLREVLLRAGWAAICAMETFPGTDASFDMEPADSPDLRRNEYRSLSRVVADRSRQLLYGFALMGADED